jgi:hypothetical protein
MASRKPKQKRAVVASAAQIPLDQKGITGLKSRRASWQTQAFDYEEEIGEVGYSMGYLGNSMAQLRIFAAEQPEADQAPVMSEAEIPNEELDRLDQGDGIAENLRRLAVNLSIVGECYLVGLGEKPATDETPEVPEEWSIRSIEEISTTGGKATVTHPDGTKQTLDPEADFIARLWTPSARNANRPISSMRGVLSACEEILMIDRAIRAALQSRAAINGMILLPFGMSLGGTADPTQDQQDGEGTADSFLDSVQAALVAPITNPDQASAAAPLMLQGERDDLKAATHLKFDRPIDATLDQRMERALKRLAQGLNVPVQVVLGIADVNHWGAWQIQEDAFKSHIEPLAVAMMSMLTKAFLWPMLKLRNVSNFQDYQVWYDASKLVVRPDRGLDAKWAHENSVINNAATRAALGFNDDDIPDDEELRRNLLLRGTRMDPTIQGQLLKGSFAPDIQIPEPSSGFEPAGQAVKATDTVAPKKGPPDQGAQAGTSMPASGFVASVKPNLGTQLAEIDRQLRLRLHVAADAALSRTLERAGAKLISKAKKDQALSASLSNVPVTQVARMLGPAMVESFGLTESDLVGGGFASLKKKFMSWTASAQRQALTLLGLDDQTTELAQAQQASDRSDAWMWMSGALTGLAHSMLYDPSPQAPPQGEYDDSMNVPFGLVREAVARAGGADGMEERDNFVVLVNGGTEPAGGIGTGQVITGLLPDAGQGIEGWQWVYGAYPRTHPFEPHEALDGTEFANFDDEVLANNEPWPATDFLAPGDHDGCACDAEPIILPLTDSSSEPDTLDQEAV